MKKTILALALLLPGICLASTPEQYPDTMPLVVYNLTDGPMTIKYIYYNQHDKILRTATINARSKGLVQMPIKKQTGYQNKSRNISQSLSMTGIQILQAQVTLPSNNSNSVTTTIGGWSCVANGAMGVTIQQTLPQENFLTCSKVGINIDPANKIPV